MTAAVPTCVQSTVAEVRTSFLPPRLTFSTSSAPVAAPVPKPMPRSPPMPEAPTAVLMRDSSPPSIVNCCPRTVPTPIVRPVLLGASHTSPSTPTLMLPSSCTSAARTNTAIVPVAPPSESARWPVLVVLTLLPAARRNVPIPSPFESDPRKMVPLPALTFCVRVRPSRACKPRPLLVFTTPAVIVPEKLPTNALLGVSASPMVTVPTLPLPT